MRARSSAAERPPDTREVAGAEPAGPTIAHIGRAVAGNLRRRRDELEMELDQLREKLTPALARHRALKASGERVHRPERRHLGKALEAMNDAIAERKRELTSVLRLIASSNGPQRTVTDHAVLRWLERKHGLDRGQIESEIRAFFGIVGDVECDVVTVDGWQAVVRGRHIVTIKPPGYSYPGAASRRRNAHAQSTT